MPCPQIPRHNRTHQQQDQQDTARQQDCLTPQDNNIRVLMCMAPCPRSLRRSKIRLGTTSLLYSMRSPWDRIDLRLQCTLEVDCSRPHRRSQLGKDCPRRPWWTTGNTTPPVLFRNRSPYQTIHHCRKNQPGKLCPWSLSCPHRNRILERQYRR